MGTHEWDLGVSVLSTYDEDGFLGHQVDATGENKAGVVPYETHHFHGFIGRAGDATRDGSGEVDPATAHQLLFAMEGGKGHSYLLENPALVLKLPNLLPAETMHYGPMGQFQRMKADGSIARWAPTNEDGQADFQCSEGPDGIEFSGRWGSFKMNDTGLHILCNGGEFHLQAVGGLPGPIASIGQLCTIVSGSFDAQCTGVSLGADGPVPTPPAPIVNGLLLFAWMGAVVAALKTIQAAIATASPTSGITPAQIAAVTSAVSAVIPPTPVFYTNASATF